MNATLLDVLQNANAIEILVRILADHELGTYSTVSVVNCTRDICLNYFLLQEIANNIFQACYNLCRLNKARQEEAAQAGIISCLKLIIRTSSPLKQFAIPMLCDLASATKSCRTLLWQNEAFEVYVELLEDPYFQVSALEAFLAW